MAENLPPLPQGATFDLPPLPTGASFNAPPLPPGATTTKSNVDLSRERELFGSQGIDPELAKALEQRAGAYESKRRSEMLVGIPQGLGGSVAGGVLTDFLNIPSSLFNLGAGLGERYMQAPSGTAPRAPTLPGSTDIASVLFGDPVSKAQAQGREGGALIGGVALGATVPKFLSSIISGGTKIVQTALGRPLKAAEKTLIDRVQELGTNRLSELSAEEKATLKRLSDEQRAAEAKLASETSRKTMAERAGERATAAEERAKLGLKGTSETTEFGERMILPMTKQKIGEDIRSLVSNFVESIKSVRKAKADAEFQNAFGAAADLEKSGASFTETAQMKGLKSFIDDRLSKTTDPNIARNLERIRDALFVGRYEGKKLVATPSFKSAEDIRRLLGDAVSGVPAEGYDAIGQNLARDLYGKLTDAMKGFSPGFGKYLDRYRKLSENIEAAGTKLGKAVIGEEKNAPGFHNTSADKLADKVFASPESIRTFTEAIGGNKQPVEALAERYISNQLASAKTAEEARKILTSDKMRSVLEELGPAFRSRIENQYFSRASQQSKIVTEAQSIVEKSNNEITNLNKQISDLVKKTGKVTEEAQATRTKIESELEGLRLAISDADRNTRAVSLLRSLEGQVSPETYAQAENLVRKVVDESAKKSAAQKTLLKTAGYIGLGTATSYFGLPKILGGQ